MSPKRSDVMTNKYGSVECPTEEKSLIAKPKGKVLQVQSVSRIQI